MIRAILLQVIELPLTNPELFQRVGINPPKGSLLFGPPGIILQHLILIRVRFRILNGKSFKPNAKYKLSLLGSVHFL